MQCGDLKEAYRELKRVYLGETPNDCVGSPDLSLANTYFGCNEDHRKCFKTAVQGLSCCSKREGEEWIIGDSRFIPIFDQIFQYANKVQSVLEVLGWFYERRITGEELDELLKRLVPQMEKSKFTLE